MTPSILTKNQKKTFGPVPIKGWGAGALIKAVVRYDDDCGNGHNSFSVTGEIYIPGRRDIEAGGCLHDEIAKHFPELATLIKWHLVSSDGPIHYISNTLYWTRGEYKRQLISGSTKKPVWTPVLEDAAGNPVHMGHHDLVDADECPATRDVKMVYKPVMRDEGTPRNLDNARKSAVWPEATDEELTSPDLEQKLRDRLPALLAEFKQAVESLGFVY